MPAPDPEDAIVPLEAADVVGSDPWLETRLDHPEDVAVAPDGTLYTGGEDGQLYHVDPTDGSVVELARTGGFVLGVTLGPDGDLYACDFQEHAVFRIPMEGTRRAGDPEVVVSGDADSPPWHPNYCVFDDAGRLYVSDSGDRSDMSAAGGCIYVREPDGEERVLTDRCSAFPNGLALSNDGSRLYVAETGTHAVWELVLENGEVTDHRVRTDDMGLIDGLAVDSSDRLYGASIGDNTIYRMADDTVEVFATDPTGLTIGNPTNVALDETNERVYVANLALWHVTALPFRE
jgi:sugar lactone lactonase YvrE